MSIYTKLLAIQKEVKGLSKDKKSHNYDYVTGNKLLSFIKPIMDKQGVILKQEILSIENTRQDYKTKYGEKSEILSKVMMRFTWIDCETGEKDENLFGANGQNDWEKGLGSALTYGERYFLLKFFHIATDEDDIDNPERKEKEKKAIEDRKPSLTISQFESSKKGSKEQIKVVLNKFRMTTIQRDELTKLSL
tara:strand:- start:56 stop:631 length:576 start_codon:yes stop_codon:yes gene_type:complete